jgi:hypothetical protein
LFFKSPAGLTDGAFCLSLPGGPQPFFGRRAELLGGKVSKPWKVWGKTFRGLDPEIPPDSNVWKKWRS